MASEADRTASATTSPGHEGVHPGIALLVIAGAQLMIVLDATIVNIALPHIQSALGFSNTNLAWVLNAYTLTFGGLLLLGGRSGDIFGRRRMFITGILIFAGASLAGGLAQSQAWLLAARVVQGAGGAIASPTALSLVTTNFPEGRERNRAFGVYAAVSGAGAAIGLILGGVLTSWLSWRWVLFVNVPIGIALAIITPYVIRESEKHPGKLDLPGAITSTLGIGSLVFAFIHAASLAPHGWTNSVTIVAFALAIVLLGAFFVIESHSEQPLMPLRLFQNRNRTAGYIVMFSMGAALFSMFFYLTQFVQEILGYSALKAGFAFVPVSIAIVISAQIASRAIIRTGPRPLVILGCVVAGVGLAWLSTITAHSGYVSLLLPTMIVVAIGLGFVFVPITLTAVAGVESRDAGIASAMLNVTQQIGGTTGLAVLVTVSTTVFVNTLTTGMAKLIAAGQPSAIALAATKESALAHAWGTSFRAACAFAIIGLVAAIFGLTNSRDGISAQGLTAAAA